MLRVGHIILALFFSRKLHENETRMHSSRMHTVRSSGRISRGVPGPGGVYLVRGVYLVWGSTWSGGYLVQGGCTWSGGCTCSRGCTWSGGVYLVQGVYLVWEGVPGPRRCTWSGGVYLVLGGVPGQGEGVYLVWGGVPGWGVYLVRGGTSSGTPPCGQTHVCNNITFATSLRTVKIGLRRWTARRSPRTPFIRQ